MRTGVQQKLEKKSILEEATGFSYTSIHKDMNIKMFTVAALLL